MKKMLMFALCLMFWGCADSKDEKNTSAKFVDIYPQVVALTEKGAAGDEAGAKMIQDSLLQSGIAHNLIEDTASLISRAATSGYTLITPNELNAHNGEFVIISTLPRGIYNLGLIPNAKHFEFAISPTLNDNGSEWNWEADALSRPQEEFIHLLGENKDAKIVFYDSGEHIYAPMGSAHIGIMWAKHLGYTQLYRLVGGFNAWKDLGLPITTEKPHCCEM